MGGLVSWFAHPLLGIGTGTVRMHTLQLEDAYKYACVLDLKRSTLEY